MTLAVTLLGDVSIQTGPGAPTTEFPGSAQARVAFALLTLERHHGATRDALADAMWPDELPPTWASALRTVVSRVRAFVAQSLGVDTDSHDVLVARGGSYWLRLPDDTVVDVEQADGWVAAARQALTDLDPAQARELAEEAVGRLGAPFLPDYDGDWLGVQRQRLGELLVVGLEITSQAAAGLGDTSGALAAAHEAVARASLRESAHRCVMAAHAAAGNRGEALRAYQRLRRMLVEELGVDPDAETEAAYLQLLGSARTASGDERRRSPSGSGAPGLPPFFGRQAPLDAALDSWSQAKGGRLQGLLVTGEAGIGKTRFAVELAQRISADGGLVLLGGCDPQAAVPYQVVADLLDPVVAALPDDELPAMSTAARAELAALLPAWRDAAGPPRTPDPTVLFDGVARIFRHLAGDHPLLLVLDDMHEADEGTWSLLRHLVRRLADTRLMLVAAGRDDVAPDHPLAAGAPRLETEGLVRRLHLSGLDQEASAALARHTLPAANGLGTTVHKLSADTAGNPLLLTELVRALGEDAAAAATEPLDEPVSSTIDDLAAGRVRALRPEARALVHAATVAGGPLDLDTLGPVAGLDRSTALDVLEELLATSLLSESDSEDGKDRYRFTHEAIRRALYRQLSGARRRDLHERLADVLEDGSSVDPASADPARWAATIAHHRCAGAEAGGDVRAVRWALAAAAQASTRGARAEVIRWCREAQRHVAPGDTALESEVLTELGLAQLRGGEADGEPTLLGAAARATRSGRLDIAARAALGLADLARARPDLAEEASSLIREVLAGDQPQTGRTGPGLARISWARLVARQVQLGGLRPPDTTQAATAAAVLQRQLDGLAGPDGIEARVELATDLQVVALATNDSTAQVVAHRHLADAAGIVGDQTKADMHLETLADLLRADGDPRGDVVLAERALVRAVMEGRFTEAPGHSLAVGRSGAPTPRAPIASTARQVLVARWLQGRLEVEPEWPSEVLAPAESLAAEALVAGALGERGAARLKVQDALRAMEAPPEHGDARLHVLGVLGLAAIEVGDPEVAADLMQRLSSYGTLCCADGCRSFVGTVTFHLGRLAALGGDLASAERHLVAALRQLTAMGARPWVALAQHALADVIDARGRSSDREWISALRQEGRSLASDLGLRSLA